MTPTDLGIILDRHSLWVKGNKTGKRAEFCGLDLRGAYMGRANLCRAVFRNCMLSYATFYGADLRGAAFKDCGLNNADFDNVNAPRMVISSSSLTGTRFRDAVLHCSYLCGNSMRGTSFLRADLRRACLSTSNMDGVMLNNAVCAGITIGGTGIVTDLRGVKIFTDTWEGSKSRMVIDLYQFYPGAKGRRLSLRLLGKDGKCLAGRMFDSAKEVLKYALLAGPDLGGLEKLKKTLLGLTKKADEADGKKD